MTSTSVNHAHIFRDKLTSTYNAPSFSRSRWAGIFWASSFPSCRNGCESELLQMIDFSFHIVSYLSCISYISIIQGLDDRKYTWPDLESKTGPFEPKPFCVVNRFPVPVFVGIKGSIFSCLHPLSSATSWPTPVTLWQAPPVGVVRYSAFVKLPNFDRFHRWVYLRPTQIGELLWSDPTDSNRDSKPVWACSGTMVLQRKKGIENTTANSML